MAKNGVCAQKEIGIECADCDVRQDVNACNANAIAWAKQHLRKFQAPSKQERSLVWLLIRAVQDVD